jgi:hypothetical protein
MAAAVRIMRYESVCRDVGQISQPNRERWILSGQILCRHSACFAIITCLSMRSRLLARVSSQRIARQRGVPKKPILAMEGNQLVSRTSSSASRAGATGRLLTWAVAATMACGAVGLSGATSANAATGSEAVAAHKQINRQNGPWLDSAWVELDALTDAPGQVFAVTANGGVPWVYDPRAPLAERWRNLRTVVPGSQGGFVLNITIAAEENPILAPTENAVLIKARTAAGIFQTRCVVERAGVRQLFTLATATPPNCSTWARISP